MSLIKDKVGMAADKLKVIVSHMAMTSQTHGTDDVIEPLLMLCFNTSNRSRGNA